MKNIALAAVALFAVSGCTSTSSSTNSLATKAPADEVRTVQFEGSDVQVSWNPAAKTRATLIYSAKLSIWSNDAEQLITEATGCKADAWRMSYPQADQGFQAVSMPIRCK